MRELENMQKNLYTGYQKKIESNMLKNIEQDQNQLNYLYSNNTGIMLEDIEKILMRTPIFLRELKGKNEEMIKKTKKLDFLNN